MAPSFLQCLRECILCDGAESRWVSHGHNEVYHSRSRSHRSHRPRYDDVVSSQPYYPERSSERQSERKPRRLTKALRHQRTDSYSQRREGAQSYREHVNDYANCSGNVLQDRRQTYGTYIHPTARPIRTAFGEPSSPRPVARPREAYEMPALSRQVTSTNRLVFMVRDETLGLRPVHRRVEFPADVTMRELLTTLAPNRRETRVVCVWRHNAREVLDERNSVDEVQRFHVELQVKHRKQVRFC